MDFNKLYDNYKQTAEKYFNTCFDSNDNLLNSAYRYCFFGKGKRIRPVLMLAFADYFKLSYDEILPFCFSIECVHIHSLIHDDLPALDNDDFRRGEPTCHKVYGEDMAILAGDFLLNFAYLHALSNCKSSKNIECLQILSKSTADMLNGQALDTRFDKKLGLEEVLNIYQKKTCSLITAAMVIPAILSGNCEQSTNIVKLGENLGLLFQITDDILDYNKGKTEVKQKTEPNIVELFGIDKAIKLKDEYYYKSLKTVESMQDFEFIKFFVDYIYKRVK